MTGKKRTNQRIAFWIFRIHGGSSSWGYSSGYFGFIIWHGAGVINWKFLTTAPTDGMTGGASSPAIVGTFCLIAGSMVVAFPLEGNVGHLPPNTPANGKIVRFIRIMTNNLGSIPSIIFGLFGMALFVNALGFENSIIAGSFTLGLLALPAGHPHHGGGTQGRPRFVPHGQPRPRSHQTSDDMARGAAYGLPQHHDGPHPSPSDVCRAKRRRYSSRRRPTSCPSCRRASTTGDGAPYHLYVIATSGTDLEATRPMAYGTALVLIVIVLAMNLLASFLRRHFGKKVKTN